MKFQDGSPFDADSVLLNMQYFKRSLILFSKLHEVLDRVEKLNSHRVRFVLKELWDFFTRCRMASILHKSLFKKICWNGKPTCPNLAEPGPYGLGPYILKEGYIEGIEAVKRLF